MTLLYMILFMMLFPIVGSANSDTLIDKSTIVFVCEHGSAKSVVATAYFNRIARDQGLNFRAVSRGTTPDAEVAPAAVKGLRTDGINIPLEKPERFTANEASAALRVVSFCDLSDDIKEAGVERWEVPAISENYSKARDAIVKKIQELVRSLKK